MFIFITKTNSPMDFDKIDLMVEKIIFLGYIFHIRVWFTVYSIKYRKIELRLYRWKWEKFFKERKTKKKKIIFIIKKWERVKFYFYPSNMRVMVWKIMKGKYTTIGIIRWGVLLYFCSFCVSHSFFFYGKYQSIIFWNEIKWILQDWWWWVDDWKILLGWNDVFFCFFLLLKLINLMKRMKKIWFHLNF